MSAGEDQIWSCLEEGVNQKEVSTILSHYEKIWHDYL